METDMLRSCMDGIGDKFVAEGVRLHQRRQPRRVAMVTVDARGVPALTLGLAGEARPPPPLASISPGTHMTATTTAGSRKTPAHGHRRSVAVAASHHFQVLSGETK